MEENGIVDILGQMKNNFNKPLPILKKVMDPIVNDSDDFEEKSSNLEEVATNEADSDALQTEIHNNSANNASIAQLGTLTSEDDMSSGNKRLNKNVQIKTVKNLDASRTSKRTRRRANSKSVIQNAIARKEKSFGVYENPKSRRNHSRTKILVGNKKTESLDRESFSVKKQTSQKKAKLSPQIARKSVATYNSDELDDSSNVRRSRRTVSSENRKSSATVARDEDAKAQAQLMSRLCKCTENKELYMESEKDSQFCTAVDNISNKLIGCSRLVDIRSVPMFRPSTRVPFGVFCESHRQRLIRHNCCPTCGVFCTQGDFSECQSKHHFHKDCKISIGDKAYCPHCGNSDPSTDIVITMYSSKKPVFLPVQRSHHTTAKMGFKETKDESSSCTSREDVTTPPIIPIELMEVLNTKVNIQLEECNEYKLVEAIESNDSRQVAAILEHGSIDLKVRLADYNNGTFLHLATLKGSIEIVYLLVSNHIDMDILDSEQNSAVMLAALEHKNDIVGYLIKAGADITLKGVDGMTSLHVAAKAGNLEACKTILTSSAGISNFVNLQDDGGWTPLVWACEHGHDDVAKYLVSKGADVNIRDVEHNIALHWAAFKGSSRIVELLLNLKSDINVVNVHGDTPLHISAREDHYNCVILFLSRRADISIINKNNEIPLDCAPKDGLCFAPLYLNNQLRSAISVHACNSLLTNDISRGRESNPIQCCNSVDSEGEPASFIYVKKNCLTSDKVRVNVQVSTMQSCSCNDRCKSADCKCATLSLKCWYDDQGKLLPDFNFYDPPLIFECNDMCACNAILCTNRLVQKPLTQRFQLFKTISKGWGIKSLNYIASGNYVCEYVGEILTDTEAEQREDDSYLFDLDNRETDSFCIDAKFYGNFARFINHSCDPNLHPLKVFIEHHDLRFPRIAFFAKRDIAPDEELSFDYGDKFWLVKYKSFTCDCKTDVCKYSKETIAMTLEKYQMTI